ncbi:hypothetical protein DTO006G1_8243 [Penicillium roqueforti]|uniref:uncharacterized protein n=1 Tax=Penicillium roqueforti TaxID=5082 RepID=UPI00190C4386|nr:uncharacterized protein LCP9604111_8799 [Penicillium roqueforti]KAF9240321.1 hypothetical protein LCP9604111_8799 [Penicillium roqueforti]KAI1835306.1 hypothetical protein CBS147337_4123 [Penicillium roqueforti]KAI2677319.1 hypothetical protein CBS147355_5546 [Penicillium roqueforti]KAI2688384.1 hypothetical protein LCP963914a_2786 [Penicillium roqueforti]KAI2700561.1 hypothetical protein CBS147372_5340 [Penicillium roqueforti]
MWPPFDEPKPEQANRSTQTSPDLSSKWGQVAIAYLDNKSMRDEVERLLERIKIAENKAETFERDRLLAEEQARQRGELLDNAIRESNVARKENRILMTKIASLQAGTETFSDEEAKQEMCLLYHDLEHWRFTHFAAKPAQQGNDPTPRSDSLDISSLDIIQSEIAGLIYRFFWNQFMLGAEQSWSNYLRKVDSEINKQFSSHISRHWRCAMSSAILSLETSSLQEQCNWIIEKAEACFGRYAVTERLKRMQQLHGIIARCIKFKHKLDCQEDKYVFWGSYQYGLRFRGKKMRTLTEEDTSDGFVQASLWPGLYKIVEKGEWSTIEKEIVKKIPPVIPSVEMVDDMESYEGNPDLIEI